MTSLIDLDSGTADNSNKQMSDEELQSLLEDISKKAG